MKTIENFTNAVIEETATETGTVNQDLNVDADTNKQDVTEQQPVATNEQQQVVNTPIEETKDSQDDNKQDGESEKKEELIGGIDALLDDMLADTMKKVEVANNIINNENTKHEVTPEKNDVLTDTDRKDIEEIEKKTKDELDKIDDSTILKEKVIEFNTKYIEKVLELQAEKVARKNVEQLLEQQTSKNNNLLNEKNSLEREVKNQQSVMLDDDLKELNSHYRLCKENNDVYSIRNVISEASKIISKASGRDFAPYVIEFIKGGVDFSENGAEEVKVKNTQNKQESKITDIYSLL